MPQSPQEDASHILQRGPSLQCQEGCQVGCLLGCRGLQSRSYQSLSSNSRFPYLALRAGFSYGHLVDKTFDTPEINTTSFGGKFATLNQKDKVLFSSTLCPRPRRLSLFNAPVALHWRPYGRGRQAASRQLVRPRNTIWLREGGNYHKIASTFSPKGMVYLSSTVFLHRSLAWGLLVGC